MYSNRLLRRLLLYLSLAVLLGCGKRNPTRSQEAPEVTGDEIHEVVELVLKQA